MNTYTRAGHATPGQVAGQLGVSASTVLRWCRGLARGRRLRSVRLGGRVYVPADALAEFLNPPAGSPAPTEAR